jgi:EmrB/QacA subfamily drug resistance transporter
MSHAQARAAKRGMPGPGHPSNRWWVLGVIGLAQLMIVLDSTIMNIALPSAQKDLAFSNDVRQWIVTAYSLAFGSLLLVGGRLSDMVGRKVMFVIGLCGFAAASALGGAALNFEMLTVARAIQGLFGAVMAPAALSLLTTTFADSSDRSKAFAIYGAIAGAGGAVGLLLGGVLTEYLDWRWCLYVNVIFAVIAVTGAVVLIPRHPADDAASFDIPGTVTAVGGLFCIVYGLSNAETHDWHTPSTWGFLVAGAAALIAFGLTESRMSHPLLPLHIPGDRNRGGSYLSIFLTGSGMFGVFLFLTYYLQDLRGYSAVRTGVAFLPMVVMLVLAAQIATIVVLPRFGPKLPITIGMLLAAGGMAWLTQIGLHDSYTAHILPPLLVSGLGIGFAMPPAMNVATQGVRPADAGVASAMANTSQQVGGSIGVSLLSTIAAEAVTRFLAGKRVNQLTEAQAALHSYTVAFWWSAGIFAAGGIICGLLLRSGKIPPTARPTQDDYTAAI